MMMNNKKKKKKNKQHSKTHMNESCIFLGTWNTSHGSFSLNLKPYSYNDWGKKTHMHSCK